LALAFAQAGAAEPGKQSLAPLAQPWPATVV
jgi:hypothetical protein